MNKCKEDPLKRLTKNFHDGTEDRLVEVEPLDLSRIDDFDDMLEAMSRTSFGGRRVGEGTNTLFSMVSDKDTFVVMTLSGAMTIAKMGRVVCGMIDRGFVHAIIATGALVTHGFVESSGATHFKYDPSMDDMKLFKLGYNRVYDTLELEKNLDDVERTMNDIFKDFDPGRIILSSRFITEVLGRWLVENTDGPGILKSAYIQSVPVYIPAFTDSEIGLNLALLNRKRRREHKRRFIFDPFLDLEHYTELINLQEKLGIFTIGGGVPRNWGQQVGPYLDLIQDRAESEEERALIRLQKFLYALRICPDAVHWGGLSGCTYSEGVSWGKFVPEEMGGRHTEIFADATTIWPMVIMGVIQRLEKRGIKIEKTFDLRKQTEAVLMKMVFDDMDNILKG
jgi:deoxyhypusine synthase